MFPEPTVQDKMLPIHTGLWWQREHALQAQADPHGNWGGQGIWLKVVDPDEFSDEPRFAMYHFAYAPSGERRWLRASGTIAEGLHGLPLFDASATGIPHPEAFGKCSLRFDSPVSGVFHYRDTDFGRGIIDLQLLALAGTDVDGLYYDPRYDGEGFAIQMIGGKYYLYWFHRNGTWDLVTPECEVLTPTGNGLFRYDPVTYVSRGQARFADRQFEFEDKVQNLVRIF